VIVEHKNFHKALFGWGSGFEKMDLKGFEWIVWG